MILDDLIAKHGRVITKKKKVGWGEYEEKELGPGSQEELSKMVVKWFADQGWKSKLSKRSGDYISRIDKHHTKITWRISSGYGNIYASAVLHKKTPNGGWTTLVRSYRSRGDLGALVTKALTIPKPTMVTKETLPDPIIIGSSPNYSKVRDHNQVSFCGKWRYIRVMGVVGLEKNGTICAEKVYEPTETPWFHCVVNDHLGSTAHIITDGDKLHSLNPRLSKGERKFRVTTNDQDHVKNTTPFDKQMLAMAIDTLFESKPNGEKN
jgi:hypothetical protein